MRRFVPPSLEELREALGKNPEPEFQFENCKDFEVIPTPRDSDWLASTGSSEEAETYDDFIKKSKQIPDATRNTIYLLPFGAFEKQRSPSLDLIKDFVSIFYQLPSKILPRVDPSKAQHTFTKRHHAGHDQYLSSDILSYCKKHLPSDAFCMLAVTMTDLYPKPEWNFVFGQASLKERVGVFSFARFDPTFYGYDRDKDYEMDTCNSVVDFMIDRIQRFGIRHCHFFNCLMRGSNHLRVICHQCNTCDNNIQEADSKPMYFCPICLRKLHSSVKFDVVKQHLQIAKFCEENGYLEEAKWYKQRVETINKLKMESKNTQ